MKSASAPRTQTLGSAFDSHRGRSKRTMIHKKKNLNALKKETTWHKETMSTSQSESLSS